MIKIAHISDWHVRDSYMFRRMMDYEIASQNLEQPDCVFITGDMVRNFNPSLKDFGNEARLQRHIYESSIDHINEIWPGVDIIAVRGNHDWCDYGIDGSVKAFDRLGGEVFEWNGLKIAGFRGVPAHVGFWQDEYSERQLDILCQGIPSDSDILVSHAPPYGIMDDVADVEGLLKIHGIEYIDLNGVVPHHIGSNSIRDLVDRLPNLKLHVFGHVHEHGGKVEDRHGKVFSNAACSLNYLEV